MGLYENIKTICAKKGISVSELEKSLNLPRSSIAKYNTNTPSVEKVRIIAERLNVTIDELMGMPSIPRITNQYVYESLRNAKESIAPLSSIPHRHLIPVLGRVSAGFPIEAEQEILDWEEISDSMAATGEFFALKIQGDSMEPKFSHGDTVIIKQQQTAEDGDFVIAIVNGNEGVCKKLKKYKDGIALVSLNPAYSPMYFSKEEINTTPVQIIGLVKELRAKF